MIDGVNTLVGVGRRGEDTGVHAGHAVRQQWVSRWGGDANGVSVDGFNLVDGLRVHGTCWCGGLKDMVQGAGHGLGIKCGAVLELHVLTEFKFPDLIRGLLPRSGQHWLNGLRGLVILGQGFQATGDREHVGVIAFQSPVGNWSAEVCHDNSGVRVCCCFRSRA